MANFTTVSKQYLDKLQIVLGNIPLDTVSVLAEEIKSAWHEKRQMFIFGNGGSAGNAMHLANDYLYGVGASFVPGLKVHALPSNASIVTCLANDIGYESIFVEQLKCFANEGDILLALSGSGNSKNIVEALEWGNINKLKTFSIVGYDGGKAKKISNLCVHLEIDDMQISEDSQLIIGHIIMQWLNPGKC